MTRLQEGLLSLSYGLALGVFTCAMLWLHRPEIGVTVALGGVIGFFTAVACGVTGKAV